MEGCTTLDSVQVRRSLPNTLVFVYQEAEAKYGIINGDQIYVLSSAGRIIDMVQRLDNYPDLILLSGPDVSGLGVGDFLEQDSFHSLVSALNAAATAGIGDIRGAAIDGVEVSLNYQDRVTIHLGNVLDLDYKFSLVNEVLFNRIGSSEAGVLDASMEGRVTFRPMPLAEQSESLNQLAVIRNQGGTITADQAAQQTAEQTSPEQGQAPQDTTSENTSSDGAASSGQEGENSTQSALEGQTSSQPSSTGDPGAAGDTTSESETVSQGE